MNVEEEIVALKIANARQEDLIKEFKKFLAEFVETTGDIKVMAKDMRDMKELVTKMDNFLNDGLEPKIKEKSYEEMIAYLNTDVARDKLSTRVRAYLSTEEFKKHVEDWIDQRVAETKRKDIIKIIVTVFGFLVAISGTVVAVIS